MPYQRGLCARRDPWCRPDQVFNAWDSKVDVSAVDDAPAAAVAAGMEPLLSGQAVPRLGERWVRDYDEPCGGCL